MMALRMTPALQPSRPAQTRRTAPARGQVLRSPAPVLVRRAPRIVAKAAAGAGGADPYEVLGLSQGADFDTVNRAYKRLVYECKKTNDKERAAAIESAHSTLMTRFMMQRIQSGASSSVKGLDEVPLLPWRPRILLWAYKWMALSLVAGLLPVLWVVVSPSAGPQPIQFTFFAYLVLNCLKQWQWSPPPTTNPKEQQRGVVRVLMRGAGLTLGSVSLGIFFAWSVPDMIMGAVIKGALPAAFYESQWMVMTAGAAAMGFIINAFFR